MKTLIGFVRRNRVDVYIVLWLLVVAVMHHLGVTGWMGWLVPALIVGIFLLAWLDRINQARQRAARTDATEAAPKHGPET